ncbi:hypothetical protein M8J76_011409 [Diaphorina citri]|nr:hypothetical protein M8J76_011409 [Diaphorina citri]
MDYTKVRRYILLIPLHVFGLISLPNFYRHAWMNKAHRLIYRSFMWTIIALTITVLATTSFIYAIHDLSEFLQRILESISITTFSSELVYYNLRLGKLIELFDLQEQLFKVSNVRIHRKYLLLEWIELAVVLLLNVLLTGGLLMEPFLPMTERNMFLLTSIYHRKHPSRTLPIPIWTPSFISIDEKRYYVLFFLFEIYIIVIVLITITVAMMLLILFPSSLAGQYEMLEEFIKLLGVEHRNACGELIFYTDVATGTNNKTKHEISKEDLNMKLKQWRTKEYPYFYLKQIVKRQQTLDLVMKKYKMFLKDLYESIFAPFIVIWVLAFYQMAYMKHLPFYNRFKIVFEFLYTFLAVFQFAIKSESLNDCHVRLAGALYQSRWYNCSPEVRKTLCILLRNFQDSRHFFLLRGIVKVAFTFLLRMVNVAFSFINFVKLRGQL